MKMQHYILVADSGAARIYKAEYGLDKIELVHGQDNPAGRKTRSELETDRPGMQRNDGGGVHGFGGDNDAHRHESEQFARTLCKWLHTEHQTGNFTSLLIAAPPHFLGDLRKHLSKDCQQVLGKTVNKDLLRSNDKDIIAHFI